MTYKEQLVEQEIEELSTIIRENKKIREGKTSVNLFAAPLTEWQKHNQWNGCTRQISNAKGQRAELRKRLATYDI